MTAYVQSTVISLLQLLNSLFSRLGNLVRGAAKIQTSLQQLSVKYRKSNQFQTTECESVKFH